MDVFDLVAKIRLDDSEYKDGVDKAQGSFSKLASGVGKGLATVAKVGAAAVTAGAAGVAALAKMGIDGYAQYEQLVGGVETLFGTGGKYITEYAASVGKSVDEVRDHYQSLKRSQETVLKNADNAYKTAGLSANAYMETVTSFSASLIQSLGGDTEKAANVADMAIIDMSDNANKMGTSMEMIQNAYQGFAKQNYTMLDNLKLGYGGTKEEMERLLEDAQKLSGIEYDISSFADIAQAIHVVQENMGIAGTTAAEAANTIQGSVGSIKAAWENLVVGMADDNANLDVLINNFVESALAMASQIMPRIEQTLVGIGALVAGLAPIIAEKLPGMVESILPTLLTAAVTLVTTVFNALPGLIDSMLPIVIRAALDVVMSFINVVTENAGMFLQTGFDAIMQIVNGIAQSLPDIIAAAITIVLELVNTLTSQENLNLMLDTAMLLVEKIVVGLIDAVPKLIDAAIQLVDNLIAFIIDPDNMHKLLDMAVRLVITVMDGFIGAIPKLVDAAVMLIQHLVDYLTTPDRVVELVGAALSIVLAIVGGLIEARVELAKAAIELITELIGNFEETDWKKVGSDIIDTILKGLKEAWSSVTSWFSGVWDSLFNRSVDVSSDGNGKVSVKGKSHATGLDYVPYDGYRAILHRGETVLTAAEARAYRNGTGGLTDSRVVSLLGAILDATVNGNAEMVQAVNADKKLSVSGRDFARLVKEYA